MKKRIISLFFVLVLAAAFALPARCAEGGDIAVLWENLPPEALELIPEELRSADLYGASELLTGKYGFTYFWNAALKLLPASFRTAATLFSTLLAMLIVSGLVKSMRGSVGGEILDFASCLAVAVTLLTAQKTILDAVTSFLSHLVLLVDGMNAVSTAVYLSSGNITAASVSSSALMLIMTVFEHFKNGGILAMVRVSFGFSVVSAFSDSVELSSVSRLIKWLYTAALTILMAVFALVMSYQSTLAQSADNFLSRTVKFAVGTYIPIVGGALSESVQTVSASLSLLKSTAGTVGILIILSLLLPVFLTLLLNKIALMLAGAAADVLSCKKEAALIGEMSGITSFLIALVASSSFIFIFCLTLFSRSSTALGG